MHIYLLTIDRLKYAFAEVAIIYLIKDIGSELYSGGFERRQLVAALL